MEWYNMTRHSVHCRIIVRFLKKSAPSEASNAIGGILRSVPASLRSARARRHLREMAALATIITDFCRVCFDRLNQQLITGN